MTKLFTLAAVLMWAFSICGAQTYSPTSTWPYVYADFSKGVAKMNSGKDKDAAFNVHLAGNKLHFLEGGFIKSLSGHDVLAVRIGNDIYHNVSGEMLKVLARSDKALVVEAPEVDYASLNSTAGAYGSSSNTQSNMSLSSLEGIGGSNSNQSLNHMELLSNKDNGKILPLIVKKYIFVKGYKVFATKRDVMSLPVSDKAALGAFIKTNKIKWKDPASLLVLGDFLADTL